MRTDHSSTPQQRLTAQIVDFSLAALAILAPALGGSTQLWSKGVLLLALGILIFCAPPARWPPLVIGLSSLGMLLLASASFLPSAWFPTPAWRATFTGELKSALPGTLSPQPWLTLEETLLLIAGILWIAMLVTRPWALKRSTLHTVYAGGITFLAVLSLVFYAVDYKPPFWSSIHLGFFPNRNQTGNVLALGGIVSLSLAFHALQRRRQIGIFWAFSYVIIALASMMNGSRGGISILFLGSLAWLFWIANRTRLMRRLSLGMAAVMVLLTGFALVGNNVERFLPQTAGNPSESLKFRFQLQSEAVPLVKDASWHGIGLGNFADMFSRYRQSAAIQNRAIHPESDWIWLAAELGWLAPILAWIGLAGWLWTHWPPRRDTQVFLRSAIPVCAIAFWLHGFVDVSAHRVGAVWPAIFLISLLRDPETDPIEVSGASRWFRRFGFLLCGVAVWWLASAWHFTNWPSSARVKWLKAQATESLGWQANEQAITYSSEALRWAPLDWEAYFLRALGEIRLRDGMGAAMFDFHRARFIEPNLAQVPFAEGKAWLMRDPRLAMGPWYEALRRAGRYENASSATGQRAAMYSEMLLEAADFPIIRNDLRAFAIDDPRLLFLFLAQARSLEFKQEIEKLLLADPTLQSLAKDEQKLLFTQWAKLGDRDALARQIEAHPSWLEPGWFWLAEWNAAQGNHERACALAQRWAPRPTLPSLDDPRSLAQLRLDFLRSTNNLPTGFALSQAQAQAGQREDALMTLRSLTARPGSPAYLHYLEAQLCVEQKSWVEAWEAWKRYAAP